MDIVLLHDYININKSCAGKFLKSQRNLSTECETLGKVASSEVGVHQSIGWRTEQSWAGRSVPGAITFRGTQPTSCTQAKLGGQTSDLPFVDLFSLSHISLYKLNAVVGI